MAGSVLRLTIFIVVFSLPNYSVLHQPFSFIQNPFRFKTNFLRDFMKRREEIFPFSFSTPQNSRPFDVRPSSSYLTDHEFREAPNPRRSSSSSLAHHVIRHQLDPLESSSSIVISKRKLPSPVLQNERIQNFIRQRIKNGSLDESRKASLELLSNQTHNNSDSMLNSDKNAFKANLKDKSDKLISANNSVNNIKKSNVDNSNRDNINNSYRDNRKLENNVTKLEKKDSQNNQVRPTKPSNEEKEDGEGSKTSFLGYVISTLTQLPVIGNVLRASVDPLYRPILNQLQSDNETIMRGENDMKNWCFGILGCIKPTYDFFHPLYRPVNLPPYPREQIDTIFMVHSREDKTGFYVPAMYIEDMYSSTFNASRPTKLIIHGYLNNRKETWALEMVRGLLSHGDYNVISVDWSGGSYALYSQATANIRVVALEISRLLNWSVKNFQLNVSTVHIIGHSLGAHTAGYVGSKIRGIGRITGLDPAEPYFQYMPDSVRLDPSDADFVDVIHTDINSFFALTGPRGFGLQQAVGHVDFYPNGGKDQPGCNQLFSRVPMTLMMEGQDFIEGINAAQTELVNCDHVRSAKLFTDSLTSDCPYLGFSCSSYKIYREGKCFQCGEKGRDCAFMGINAALWKPQNQVNVKMFLETHYAPNFCKYHYILIINFADKSSSKGNLRGRLEITFIDKRGRSKKFDLTSLSPLRFPKRGTKSFMLEHFEDLSEYKEAQIHWTYESDLLDPLTFCVIFCKADLVISHISILSIDTPSAASKLMKMRSGLVDSRNDDLLYGGKLIMCPTEGEEAIVPNDSTVKLSTSPKCDKIIAQESVGRQSFMSKVKKAALQYYPESK